MPAFVSRSRLILDEGCLFPLLANLLRALSGVKLRGGFLPNTAQLKRDGRREHVKLFGSGRVCRRLSCATVHISFHRADGQTLEQALSRYYVEGRYGLGHVAPRIGMPASGPLPPVRMTRRPNGTPARSSRIGPSREPGWRRARQHGSDRGSLASESASKWRGFQSQRPANDYH